MDYKKLNHITIKDNFPLPNMKQTIQRLGEGYRYFTKLDLKSGFWQIPIREEDKIKTAFVTPFGLFQFNVLPQGLKNSPPTFQRVMSTALESCRQFCQVYLDDIVVFSKSYDQHLVHMKKVFECLKENNLQLNPSKCSIAHSNIDCLGYTITKKTITPLNDKINAILKLSEPRTLKQANKSIGAIAWYRKFIKKFAEVAAPIHAVTNLTKANRHKFRRTKDQSAAFYELKKMLTTAPLLLNFLDDSRPIILSTDLSDYGIGGVLQREINGETHNLYYHSQLINKAEKNYKTIEKDALAIWKCFERMRSYILGRNIIICTDHCPLCHMMEKKISNKRVERVALLLQEYNIEQVIHIKGRYNCLPDFMSRHPIPEKEEIMDFAYGLEVSQDRPPVLGMAGVTTRSKSKLETSTNQQSIPVYPSTSTVKDAPQKFVPHFDITRLKEE
ncbi:unnamed protein product [Didymodactylos carnosus]|uniref:Reverse transcriptase domain-containing protein n=1 Tax=Didymodactylos carnosus TaxID=1234261 RepID=A0A8S2GN87_9BILA|nr:unnamed protein product [Didymodactylos carnosus]CAF3538273.1 unnamed protein product [Didymodactylos carnosus]